MNKLSHTQLSRITQQVQRTNFHQPLQAELVDHIASLIEQRMDQGLAFSDAFDQAMQQANPQALSQLKQMYLREFTRLPSPARRPGIRSKRRPVAKPLQNMLLISVFAFLLLMSCLAFISRPLALPLSAFRTAWAVALVGLLAVLVVRAWLTRRRRIPKLFLTA